MHKLLAILCILSASTLTTPAKAELFIADIFSNTILVYDNFDAGLGVAPKRAISGPSTQLAAPSSIFVHTGSAPNADTELFVCNSFTSEITVFPLDADGDVAPIRTISPAATDCWDLAVYRDEIYVGYGSGGIATYPIDSNGENVAANRFIGFPPDVDSIRGIDVHNGELYALTSNRNVDEEEIWVFDADADGPAFDNVKRRVVADPALTSAWTLDVSGEEIYVGVSDGDTKLVVYDIEINAASVPIRTLSIQGARIEGLMVADGELFISDDDSDSIAIYDARSGGNVAPKRAISSGGVQDPLTSPRDVFITPDSNPDNAIFGLSLEEPLDGMTHSGVGNLRGWSVASDGIEKVELYIDGEFYQNAPYGGVRGDVAGAFPTVNNGLYSGFSLAFNYSALENGQHTIMARAYTKSGSIRESSSTFEVTKPGQEFIVDPNAVDVAGAACSINDQQIILKNMLIDGGEWDAIMKWRPAEQGFEVETYIFNNNQI